MLHLVIVLAMALPVFMVGDWSDSGFGGQIRPNGRNYRRARNKTQATRENAVLD